MGKRTDKNRPNCSTLAVGELKRYQYLLKNQTYHIFVTDYLHKVQSPNTSRELGNQ